MAVKFKTKIVRIPIELWERVETLCKEEFITTTAFIVSGMKTELKKGRG